MATFVVAAPPSRATCTWPAIRKPNDDAVDIYHGCADCNDKEAAKIICEPVNTPAEWSEARINALRAAPYVEIEGLLLHQLHNYDFVTQKLKEAKLKPDEKSTVQEIVDTLCAAYVQRLSAKNTKLEPAAVFEEYNKVVGPYEPYQAP